MKKSDVVKRVVKFSSTHPLLKHEYTQYVYISFVAHCGRCVAESRWSKHFSYPFIGPMLMESEEAVDMSTLLDVLEVDSTKARFEFYLLKKMCVQLGLVPPTCLNDRFRFQELEADLVWEMDRILDSCPSLDEETWKQEMKPLFVDWCARHEWRHGDKVLGWKLGQGSLPCPFLCDGEDSQCSQCGGDSPPDEPFDEVLQLTPTQKVFKRTHSQRSISRSRSPRSLYPKCQGGCGTYLEPGSNRQFCGLSKFECEFTGEGAITSQI